MIHLNLGDEPPQLAAVRKTRIKKVAALRNAPAPSGPDAWRKQVTGYAQHSRKALYDRQHGKCAWCERHVGRTTNPVEHVRPKLGALARDGTQDADHYWWLAWTWTNLVYSCSTCNNLPNKGNKYWLIPGTSRLSTPSAPIPDPPPQAIFDVSPEKPLLVHPRFEDPLNFLRWQPVSRSVARQRYLWTVRGFDSDDRGEATIEMLGLAGVEDQVNTHLKAILGRDKDILEHLSQGRASEAAQVWNDMVDLYLNDPKQPYRGATWWAIETLWPAAERARHGFPDPPKPSVHHK